MPIVSQNAATTPTKNRLKRPGAWQTPSNCRHFHDNLYQIHFSGCSALSETRPQSLSHPYNPLRSSAFFKISRNPGPGKLSISQKSFGKNTEKNSHITYTSTVWNVLRGFHTTSTSKSHTIIDAPPRHNHLTHTANNMRRPAVTAKDSVSLQYTG